MKSDDGCNWQFWEPESGDWTVNSIPDFTFVQPHICIQPHTLAQERKRDSLAGIESLAQNSTDGGRCSGSIGCLGFNCKVGTKAALKKHILTVKAASPLQ